MGGMKFTIRDLLWLMVVLGLGLALWIERSRNGIARQQLHVLVDMLEGADVQAEVAPNHITITGPNFASHRILGKWDPNQPPVVLDKTRVKPSIQPPP